MTDAERSLRAIRAKRAGYRILRSHRAPVRWYVGKLRRGVPIQCVSDTYPTRVEAVSALITLTLSDHSICDL